MSKQRNNKKPNKLINEKSPYLLQHAYNPVDWYSWGDEAFKIAKKENRPIFLSIGYSTCHWCHVMEKESFEDPEVAALLNDVFVSIKVDREERPDIDSVYMQVCQIMTGGGGWPLTIMMTPDKKPFFAATYIPREEKFGRTGMLELIPRIKELWSNRRSDLVESSKQITKALKDQENRSETSRSKLDESTLKLGYNQLLRRFDTQYGGFGGAPKFPSPHQLLFLLRFWKRTGQKRALNMVKKTLDEMRFGGIYDHVGFGFHRYSTDARWLVPHFEKMLYDQAMLAMAYLEAYQATNKEEYAQTTREIFEYVLRDMTSEEGGFHSAEDADSEGVEGKFYTWSHAELNSVLDGNDAEFAINVFNVREDGNFVDPMAEEDRGANILHLTGTLEVLAKKMDLSPDEFKGRLDSVRRKLFDIRKKRVHPHKDDKVLTDWNGLMIAALATGARVLDDNKYLEAAVKTTEFIMTTMRDANGRLLHRYRDGEAAINAHLDDHAFITWGLIELYGTTFDRKYLEWAVELNDQLMDHFWDPDKGGFFMSADDSEELIVRRKEVYDGAIPSGNSVAFYNLLRLSKLTGDTSLANLASIQSKAFSGDTSTMPSGYAMFMNGLDYALGPSHEVIIRGARDDPKTIEMISALRKNYLPNIVVLLNPEEKKTSFNVKLQGAVSKEPDETIEPMAYVCTNYSCKEPTSSVERMLELLKEKRK